jgi:hypothetical protein
LAGGHRDLLYRVFVLLEPIDGGVYRDEPAGEDAAFALRDIVTRENFAIAIVAAIVGYLVFEYLRKNI